MLFIEDYSKALEFHQKVLLCWLKIKIHGVAKTDNICDYCGEKECKNNGTETHKFFFSNETKLFFTFDIIERLISGTPVELLKIANSYKNNKGIEPNKSEIEKLFKTSGYTNFYQKKHGKDFINLLNRSTCTYCNRNYTLNISTNHASSQLDHWFPKSMFPILALSFFNLIPSCGSCNHMKGQSDKNYDWWKNNSLTEMLHPYFPDNNENFKFDFTYRENSDEFIVKFRDVTGNKILQTLNFNLTKKIYQAHSQLELKDLYNLRKKYTKNYIEFLLQKLHQDEPSDEEKYRLLFGIEKNQNDYHKRPFSKFKNDIIEKLLEIE
ncbi:hypothetical protein ACFQO9_01340 [Chryseobacterium zhengzhouense]|uniref:HNH domain-containing protein n=1 Tax=Chryseobacterium zhengzhouense TaxID=1636086 RepID=A0ABW2LVT6_9FLAO